MSISRRLFGKISLAAIAGALLLLNGSVQAAIITYDFGDPDAGELVDAGDNETYRGFADGVQISVFGYKGVELNGLGADVADSFDDREAVVVDTNGGSRGLSVDSEGGPDGDEDDADRLDGDGPDEALLFNLGRGGQLLEIVFDNFGGNDDFSLVIDGVVALVDVGDLDSDIWLGDLAFSRHFAIGADGVNDEFRVRSVTVDVPEPATFALLLFGLLGLRTQRRSVNHA